MLRLETISRSFLHLQKHGQQAKHVAHCNVPPSSLFRLNMKSGEVGGGGRSHPPSTILQKHGQQMKACSSLLSQYNNDLSLYKSILASGGFGGGAGPPPFCKNTDEHDHGSPVGHGDRLQDNWEQQPGSYSLIRYYNLSIYPNKLVSIFFPLSYKFVDHVGSFGDRLCSEVQPWNEEDDNPWEDVAAKGFGFRVQGFGFRGLLLSQLSTPLTRKGLPLNFYLHGSHT